MVEPNSAVVNQLLDEARQGRTAALEQLFAHFHDRLRQAVALRLDRRLSARVDASDVLQEAYLEAVRRLPDYLNRSGMPFYLWLRWIAGEQVLAFHRRHLGAEKRSVGREVAPLPVESSAQFVVGLLGRGPSPSRALAAAELAERLRLALQRLDDDERELLLLRHFEQLTNREIAQLLQIGEAAANKRYIRALQKLRGLLLNLGVSGVE
jgi:RNA polymerase sigma-70 factor (ECF subfamily)